MSLNGKLRIINFGYIDMTIRAVWPYFMVWSRHAKKAIIVELSKMRCQRLGHRHLIGAWNDKAQKHVAFCIECETLLPDVEIGGLWTQPAPTDPALDVKLDLKYSID